MESHGQARLAERLHRLRLAEQACAGGNQHVLPAVRVERVRDQAVHRCRGAAIESIRQHRVDDRALEDAMQRTGGADGTGVLGTCEVARKTRRLLLQPAADLRVAVAPAGASARCSPAARVVARTAASAISSIDGVAASGRASPALRRRLGSADVGSLRLRPPAQHDVAGEEALVLATPSARSRSGRSAATRRLAVRPRVDGRSRSAGSASCARLCASSARRRSW